MSGAVESTVADILGEYNYDADDVRAPLGALALEAAAAIDTAQDADRAWWVLKYVLQDLTHEPREPANSLTVIRCCFISRRWQYTAPGSPAAVALHERAERELVVLKASNWIRQ